MWVKITPNDALFFRTARSFSMGSDFWGESQFPPYPSTFYGALRTLFIFSKGDLINFIKEQVSLQNFAKRKNFSIMGPFLFNTNNQKVYFPMPLDLYLETLAQNGVRVNFFATILKPKMFYSDGAVTNHLEKIIISRYQGKIKQVQGFVGDLENYLLRKEILDFVLSEEVYGLELKVGIGRSRETFTTKEGHFYQIEMNRLKENWVFLIKILGSCPENLPKKGVFPLGGEGKTVSYEIYDSNPLAYLENPSIRLENKIFKVYFATPAIFTKGFLPKWIDKKSLEGEFEGIKVKLISLALGKYLRIGGWEMGKKRPKIVYKALPAGSVYYFRLLSPATVEDVKKVFHLRNLSDILPEEGFGLTVVGEE